jgi:hypothetical protein
MANALVQTEVLKRIKKVMKVGPRGMFPTSLYGQSAPVNNYYYCLEPSHSFEIQQI